MKKLYEQSPEMHLSGKRHLRHVKCTHHKGYLMEDLSMIKSGFYEISFCKSGDFLFRIGQKRHFITNGDILVIPPDIPHYFTSSDLVANYYDFITVWLEKSYISNLKSQLPALEESVFNIDTPHLLHTTNKLCNFEEEFETFYREITEDMEKGYKKSDHGNTADTAGADTVHRPGDHGSVRNPHGGIHRDRDLREKRG